jgi:hypothetical protein
MLREGSGVATRLGDEERELPVFTIHTVTESFSLQDVTDDPDGLAQAFDIIVEGYSALSSAMLSPLDVHEELCNDAYHRSGIARTLLLTGLNPQTARIEPLGTVRITLGSKRTAQLGIKPLEAMGLMAPGAGWGDFHFESFDVDQVVEGGRIAVAKAYRTGAAKRLGLVDLAVRVLVEGGFRIAADRFGKTQYWGILPHYVIARIRATGIGVIPAPGVSLQFSENSQLFQKYDRYWLKSNPCFCKVIVPGRGSTREEAF